jgi:thymidylate synthase (FAD)
MGDDAAVVQAARVSYGGGAKSPKEDAKLINYLMRHRHTSPFEMCEIKLHIKAPIFIARQWLRHRTASVNEVSARYSNVAADMYIPAEENVRAQSPHNKQGGGVYIPTLLAQDFIRNAKQIGEAAFFQYDEYCALGVSRELARISLPQNTYTEWYWKIDLHNLLHFLKLRSAEGAQWEIRQYAEAIETIVEDWVPVTYAAWVDQVRDAVTFSKSAVEAIRCVLADHDYETRMEAELSRVGVGAREEREVLEALEMDR